MSVKIGNITIPDASGFDVRQTYEEIASKTTLRTKSGGAILQSRWKRIKSTITGSGWEPAAIDAIDTAAMQTVYCVEPLSVYGSSTTIVIPHQYRTESEYAPQASALVSGLLVATPLSMAGQTATITAVSGATQYQVNYYPIITGILTISKSGDIDNQVRGWTLTVEQE